MEIRHLRYFKVLATTLNFTRAAEKLHIAQPPLSRQIQQLEDELGVALLDRTSRPLALTRAGAFFYEQAEQLLARIHELKVATKRMGEGQRRWLGVGFVPSLLYGELPKVVHGFMKLHADLDVVLTELTSVEQAEALKSGRIDVGFGRVPIEAKGIVNTLLEEESMCAVLSAGSSLAKRKRLSLADLAEETVIVYPAHPRPSFADQVLGQFRSHGFPIDKTLETNGLQTAVGLVAAGVGVSLVPRSVQRLQRDDITYRPIADAGIVSPVLMTTRSEVPSADLSAFMKATKQAFGVNQ